jgi:hypothetical protein
MLLHKVEAPCVVQATHQRPLCRAAVLAKAQWAAVGLSRHMFAKAPPTVQKLLPGRSVPKVKPEELNDLL